MFGTTGDAIKNYYTYAYYISHNDSYTNFEGMNYPYGESFLYTDCHPILASTFKFSSNVLPFFDSHSVGILNFLMIVSIFVSFIVTYYLLVELGIRNWFSVLFSLTIVLLAPQALRLDCHFALSYSVALPLAWLLILKFLNNENRQRKYLILIFINAMFWMLIHAYLGIIIIAFQLLLIIVNAVMDKQRQAKKMRYLKILGAVVLPVILFYVYAKSVDVHTGRTDNPSGFFLSNAELDDVLVPYQKPFFPLFDQLSGGIIRLQWEARGYVGITNSLIFVALILLSVLSLAHKKARAHLRRLFDNRRINIALLAAFVLLLFAFGMPFKQFPALLDWFPIIKQFRATGRFVWPFYFAFSVFGAYVIQKVVQRLSAQSIVLSYSVLIATFGLLFTEGLYSHSRVYERIGGKPNVFKKELLPTDLSGVIAKVNPEKYQAIICFPFYHYGSESYTRLRNQNAVSNQIIISYHTGIPCMNADLTRVSVPESKNIVQVMSPNYYNKDIANDITDDRPFLIVKTGSNFTRNEAIILEKAKSLVKRGDVELLSIEKGELFSDDRPKVWKSFRFQSRQLVKQDNNYATDSCSVLYYDDFEDQASKVTYRGIGAIESVKEGETVIAEFEPGSFDSKKEYDLSIWMHNGEKDALNLWFRLIVEEYDRREDRWYTTTIFPEHAETINGDWSLVEGVFEVQNTGNKITIKTIGKENSKASFYADDLLIRDRGVDVYRLIAGDSSLFYNNHVIKSDN